MSQQQMIISLDDRPTFPIDNKDMFGGQEFTATVLVAAVGRDESFQLDFHRREIAMLKWEKGVIRVC